MQQIIFKNLTGGNDKRLGKVIFRSPKGIIIFTDNNGAELVIPKKRIISIDKILKYRKL